METNEEKRWVPFIVTSVFFGSLLALLLFYYFPPERLTPELTIGTFLVIGVLVLLICLTFTTYIFSVLKLSNSTHALGLPEGSIRAVIALSLILIFVISSVFLYYYVGIGYSKSVSTRIPGDMIDKFPNESVKEIHYAGPVGNVSSYNVTVATPKTEASEDLAKQLVTTVSTLAVAVAGFYFGSRAVEVAKGAVTAKSEPLIRTISPEGNKGKRDEDFEFTISGKNFDSPDVKLIHEPPGETITATEITSSSTTIKGKLRIPKDPADKYPNGKWTVSVINSDKSEDKLEGGFEVS